MPGLVWSVELMRPAFHLTLAKKGSGLQIRLPSVDFFLPFLLIPASGV